MGYTSRKAERFRVELFGLELFLGDKGEPMRLSYLREYVVLAKYMNISKAARELNMTQSNLSKHLRQLEAEIGAELVSHANKLEFTAAGLYFLDQAAVLVNRLDEVMAQCREIEKTSIEPLVIRQPTFNDAGTMRFYRILDRFRTSYPSVPVQFSVVRYASPQAMISAASVDAHVVYEFGDPGVIARSYAERGFSAYPLCEDRLGVWLPCEHPLAAKQELTVEDLRAVPILESNQTFAPLETAIVDLCKAHGFEAVFEFRTVNSFIEMITYSASVAVRVFPLSISEDPQLKLYPDMKLVPLGPDAKIQTLLLMGSGEGRKKAVSLLEAVLDESAQDECRR